MRKERLANMGELAGKLAHELRNPLLALSATVESLLESSAELQAETPETLGETGQAPNGQELGKTGQAPNGQELGGTGQAPNGQELGGTGQVPNGQELGKTGQAPNGQEIRVEVRLLQQMSRELGRLDKVLRDYLSLAVRVNTPIGAVRLDALLSELVGTLSGQCEQRGQRLLLHSEHELAVYADAAGLRQALHNLLLNAMEASPDGACIEVVARGHVDAIELEIQDAGPGLPAPFDQCLRPFFTTKLHGTGLGLSVAKKIIDSHQGELSATYIEGQGSRLRVRLPRWPLSSGSAGPNDSKRPMDKKLENQAKRPINKK
jgi:signal transduction histidine kinase